MLLTLVIILILIGSAVVGSLYSNFLVFYENFTETENYHKARYASIAAIERAELVIRQREPWYVWSWGWILGETSYTWYGWSDKLISDFSYLSNTADDENKSSVLREINSRTTRIPSSGNWNVDKILSSDDSPNYNMMDYENAEVFLLYYDKKLEDNPYSKKDCSKNDDCEQSNISFISGSIRLPQYVKQTFGNLNVSKPLSSGWWYPDDALVDWQLKWIFKNSSDQYVPFSIFATQDAAWGWATINDSAIRESNLNDWVSIQFKDTWDPRRINTSSNKPTIISQSNDEIKNFQFSQMFSNSHPFYNLQLRFSLLNLVLGWWDPAKRYPFLEYYLDFWNIVSDKYYNIKTEWNFWDYKVETIIFKPTITESILKSFTTIL